MSDFAFGSQCVCQAMSRRGPDVPILLYAYALFLAATSG
jgi:hypothetical protein